MSDMAATAQAEQKLNSFSSFLRNLTWEKLLPALLILVIAIVLIRIGTKLFDRALEKSKLDRTLYPFLRTSFRALLGTLAFLVVAGTLGADVSVLVAILSVLSLAVSLAIQGTLSNLVGGLVILTAHPFRVGDYIETSAACGTVERIGLTYTDLKTISNQQVHVPNSQISSTTIVNCTASGKRRMEITVGVSYQAPTGQVKQALLDAALRGGAMEDPKPEAYLASYGDSAISFLLRAWVPADSYLPIYYAVMEQIREVFAERNIEIPYPQLVLHKENEK